jgi:hypothetical protein
MNPRVFGPVAQESNRRSPASIKTHTSSNRQLKLAEQLNWVQPLERAAKLYCRRKTPTEDDQAQRLLSARAGSQITATKMSSGDSSTTGLGTGAHQRGSTREPAQALAARRLDRVRARPTKSRTMNSSGEIKGLTSNWNLEAAT